MPGWSAPRISPRPLWSRRYPATSPISPRLSSASVPAPPRPGRRPAVFVPHGARQSNEWSWKAREPFGPLGQVARTRSVAQRPLCAVGAGGGRNKRFRVHTEIADRRARRCLRSSRHAHRTRSEIACGVGSRRPAGVSRRETGKTPIVLSWDQLRLKKRVGTNR